MEFLDELGWPVERLRGRPVLNFCRLLIHTRRVVRHWRPTVTQLEAILESNDGASIEVQPDGSIKAVRGQPNHAKPKVHTIEEVLGKKGS